MQVKIIQKSVDNAYKARQKHTQKGQKFKKMRHFSTNIRSFLKKGEVIHKFTCLCSGVYLHKEKKVRDKPEQKTNR